MSMASYYHRHVYLPLMLDLNETDTTSMPFFFFFFDIIWIIKDAQIPFIDHCSIDYQRLWRTILWYDFTNYSPTLRYGLVSNRGMFLFSRPRMAFTFILPFHFRYDEFVSYWILCAGAIQPQKHWILKQTSLRKRVHVSSNHAGNTNM